MKAVLAIFAVWICLASLITYAALNAFTHLDI
jgi:hypothetical protein